MREMIDWWQFFFFCLEYDHGEYGPNYAKYILNHWSALTFDIRLYLLRYTDCTMLKSFSCVFLFGQKNIGVLLLDIGEIESSR